MSRSFSNSKYQAQNRKDRGLKARNNLNSPHLKTKISAKQSNRSFSVDNNEQENW